MIRTKLIGFIVVMALFFSSHAVAASRFRAKISGQQNAGIVNISYKITGVPLKTKLRLQLVRADGATAGQFAVLRTLNKSLKLKAGQRSRALKDIISDSPLVAGTYRYRLVVGIRTRTAARNNPLVLSNIVSMTVIDTVSGGTPTPGPGNPTPEPTPWPTPQTHTNKLGILSHFQTPL